MAYESAEQKPKHCLTCYQSYLLHTLHAFASWRVALLTASLSPPPTFKWQKTASNNVARRGGWGGGGEGRRRRGKGAVQLRRRSKAPLKRGTITQPTRLDSASANLPKTVSFLQCNNCADLQKVTLFPPLFLQKQVMLFAIYTMSKDESLC